MAGEASPIIQRLMQIVGENPSALRELMPSVGEAAQRIPFEELSQPETTDLLTRARGAVADLLSGARSAYSPTRPAASILRAQGPTSPPPATGMATSPVEPPQMSLMKKLLDYGRQGYSSVASAEGPEMAAAAPQPNLGGPPTMSQGPSMTGTGEALRRPAGLERQELLGKVKDYINEIRGGGGEEGEEGPMAALKRLKPQLQPPAEGLPPNVKEGLQRMGGLPETQYPQPAEDAPVTRMSYRGAPRVEGMSPSFQERLKTEGLKRTSLPPEAQDFLQSLVASGQLPPEITGQEGMIRNLLTQSYGYKPRALLGSEKQLGEAAPSRVGLMLQRFSELSPEEITRILGSVKPSGVYRMGKLQESAEQTAPLYQALGDTRKPEEIVADLLRGGPSTSLQGGEFARNVLNPILKKRQAAGLAPGQPLTLEQVMSALKGSRFLRSDQPSSAREELLAKVAQRMRQMGASGEPESAMEAARRGASGVNPALKSVRRKFGGQ